MKKFSDRGQQRNNPLRDRHYKTSWFNDVMVGYSGDNNPRGQWRDFRMAGVGLFALALAAFMHKRKRDVLIFLGLTLIFIDCSLGPPFPFAMLSFIITPFRLNDTSRGMFWACFPMGMMAAFGTDAIVKRWQFRPKKWLNIKIPIYIGCLLLTCVCTAPLFFEMPVWLHIPEGITDFSFSESNDFSPMMLWIWFLLVVVVVLIADTVARRWQFRSGRWFNFLILAFLGCLLLSTAYAISGYFIFQRLQGVIPNHYVLQLFDKYVTADSPQQTYLKAAKIMLLVSPGIILVLIVMTGWIPIFRRETVQATESGTVSTQGRYFAGTVSFLIVLFVFVEILIWNIHYVPYLMNWKGNNIPATTLKQEATPWNNNRRDVFKGANRNLFNLTPIINGYDPLYVASSHHVMHQPHEYRARLNPGHVTNNLRYKLFLKRSFILSKQWVKGALPDPNTPFPSLSTVFIENAPDNLYKSVSEVNVRDIIGRDKSGNKREIPIVSAGSLKKHIKRRSPNPEKLELILPQSNCPIGQNYMRVHYTSDVSAKVRIYVRELPSNDRTKKDLRIQPTHGRELILEAPLHNIESFRSTLAITMDNPDGQIEFTKAYVLSDQYNVAKQVDEDNKIKILSRKNNSVEVEVTDLPSHRILTFIDTHYPGWKAYVDSKPVDIMIANDAFKAVLVPPGTHRIKFVFKSTSAYLGLCISLSTALLITVVGIILWRQGDYQRNVFTLTTSFWDEKKELEADESAFSSPEEVIEAEEITDTYPGEFPSDND